jgi:hypothetical protein
LLAPPDNNPNAEELRLTGYIVAWLWAWGWLIALLTVRTRKQHGAHAGNVRTVYTLGCLACLFHIALAFHVGHEWSHQRAYDHTKRTSGVGEGIYVNYLFALTWTVDAIWAWIAFRSYLHRPKWISWTVHGFMGFIVFNAAVLYGAGPMRWMSLVWLAIPFGIVIASWWMRRTRTPAPECRDNPSQPG